jgi:ribosomal protein L11
MDNLEAVKKEVAANLNKYGYNGREVAAQIEKITAYYNGQPSRVEIRTQDGRKIEIYL